MMLRTAISRQRVYQFRRTRGLEPGRAVLVGLQSLSLVLRYSEASYQN
jgi:hypothetical protein